MIIKRNLPYFIRYFLALSNTIFLIKENRRSKAYNNGIACKTNDNREDSSFSLIGSEFD